jgi:ligand-binding sensor domain-containing protein
MKEPDPYPTSTLARLSFWVPAVRMAEFETIYETRIAPILKKHGLVESAERGRPAAEGMFSRLFAVESPAAVVARRAALEADPAWQELGKTFAADPQRQEIGERLARGFAEREYLTGRLDLYSTPAGPGKQVMAGPGKQRAAGRGRGRWRTFAAADGLPCVGAMRAVLQDAEGALWIGSFGGGLSRYDGRQFRAYTARDGLTSRLVQDVILAQDGTLWIGTHGNGIYHYDGQRFVNLTTADGLVSNLVLRVFQDREGCLWAGTFWGLSRWDGRSFTSFTTRDGLLADEVHAISQDREGCLWFGTGDVAGGRKGGACRYDGHRFTSFADTDGPAANKGVWSILQDREGCLWFGTAGGVSRYDGKEFKTFTTDDGLGSNEVWAILQDREGALWFGTKYGGVSRYDGQGFTTFTAQDGLGYDSVETICQDREGALWFGTWGGLSRYEAQTFTTFTAQDGLPDDQVLAICQDREGVLWFGTEKGGLCRYDGQTFTTFTTEDGLPDNRVSLLFQDREGVLWFGFTLGTIQPSGLGVCRYDGQTFTTFSVADGLADDKVGSIFQDREGALWFGTGGKVSRYDGHTFCTFTVVDGLACGNGIFVMTQDQEGGLWFGVTGGGASRYDGQQFTTFTEADGLASDVVSMLQDREGVLWLGTYGGVSRCDGRQFIPFATQDGLAEDVGAPIMQDRQGRIWFSTSTGGVHCYDGQVFQALTTQDGLADNRVSFGFAILQDQEGSLWFGTQRGVTRYRPPAPSPLSLFLDAVVADRRYEGVSEVEIPASVKVTGFEFHALSFKTRPEAMVYRYRLEGYEEEWKNTHARRVEYHDLPLGEYTFQVRAVDRDLNYSEPAEVHLKIVPDPRDARIDELEQRVRERTQELEEKNRALIVEAALERVRGRALGMQQQGDFLPVAMALFRELGVLGLHLWRSGFWIIDRDTGLTDVYTWGRWGEGQEEQQNIVRQVPLLGFRVEGEEWGKRIFERWRSQQVFRFSTGGLGAFSKDRNQWVEYMRAHGRYDANAPWPTEFSSAFGNFIPFSHGILTASTPEPLSDEEVGVLQKFAGVFSLAYTRFLDLQAAEERARQSALEHTLERVRAEVASMKESQDLFRLVGLVEESLKGLRVRCDQVSINTVDEEAGLIRFYGKTPGEITSLDIRVSRFYTPWKEGRTWHRRWTEADYKLWFPELLKGGYRTEKEISQLAEKYAGYDRWLADAFFSHGALAMNKPGPDPFSEEEIHLLERFAQVFSLGYARFLDFQRLEAQNRTLEQANLQIQQANQHKSQFLSRMSHDLRTPMNAIIGYTRILLRKLQGTIDERQYRNLENIQLSADHLLSLINDILDLSRIEAGRVELKPEPVDLSKLVQECVAAVASLLRPGVELRQQVEVVAPLHTDPDRLRRVLMNLLSNAVKFTERGSITVVAKLADGEIELSVADTGIGIPAEDLPTSSRSSGRWTTRGSDPKARVWGWPSPGSRWNCWAGVSRWRARWERGRGLR